MPPEEGNLRAGLLEFFQTVTEKGMIEGHIYQFSDPAVVDVLEKLLREKNIKLHLTTELEYHRQPKVYVVYSDLLKKGLNESEIAEEFFLKYFDEEFFHPGLTRAILEKKGFVFKDKQGRFTEMYEVYKRALEKVNQKMVDEDWGYQKKSQIHNADRLEYIDAFYRLKRFKNVEIYPDFDAEGKDDSGNLAHSKYFIVDRKRVWVGSYNITTRCAVRNPNQALWIESSPVAELFVADFLQMFDGKKFQNRKTTVSPEFPRMIDLGNDEKVEIYFSPADDIEWRLGELIADSKKTISFSAYVFSHESLANLMINKTLAKNELPVGLRKRNDKAEREKTPVSILESNPISLTGIYNGMQLSISTFDLMRAHHIPVKLSTFDGEMHNKLVVIDGGLKEGVVFTGSYNLSDSSIDNDESVVIVHSQELSRAYQDYFNKLYSYSRPRWNDDVSHYPQGGFLKRVPLAITELMYNPKLDSIGSPQHIAEFVELYNYGEEPLDLVGCKICTLNVDEQDFNKLVCNELLPVGRPSQLAPNKFAIIIDKDLDQLRGSYFDEITKGSLVFTTHEESANIGNGLTENAKVYLFHRDGYTLLDQFLIPQTGTPGQSLERVKKPTWNDELKFDQEEWKLNTQQSHSAGKEAW